MHIKEQTPRLLDLFNDHYLLPPFSDSILLCILAFSSKLFPGMLVEDTLITAAC